MPFTLFHLGPGAVFKGIGGKYFSFMVFGGSQVLIDIEPGIRILSGDIEFHGPTHTILGAIVIGTVAALIGKPISEFVLKLLRIAHARISWTASASGAYIGTLSHVFFDGLTHTDMSPLAPFSESNPILGFATINEVQLACLAMAIVGIILVVLRRRQG